MSGLKDALEIDFCGGHRYQVYVIGHQTIGKNIHPMFRAITLQPSQVELPIFVGKKDICSAVAALGDVVGHLGKDS